MSWLGRLVARRVVWVVVGVAVYAALNAAGVRAAESATCSASSTDFGSYTASNACNGAVSGGSAGSWATSGASSTGEWLQADFGMVEVAQVTLYARGDVGVGLSAADDNPVATLTWEGGGSASVPAVGINGATTIDVDAEVSWVRVTFDANTGGNPGWHEVVVTAAVGGLSCDPSCTVELSSADRDRLDGLQVGVGLAVALLAGVLVAVGLRR